VFIKKAFSSFFIAGLFLFPFFGGVFAAEKSSGRLSDQEVADYIHSGNYNKDLVRELTLARDYLDLRVNLNDRPNNHKKLAMVVAVDNTALADEPRLKKLFVHIPQPGADLWQSDEPVIWALKAFYDYALSKGVDVFFVTSRPESEREKTAHNLVREGYAGFKGLQMRPIPSKRSVVDEKIAERTEIEKEGYSIILNIGSKLHDVEGEHSSRVVLLPKPDTHRFRTHEGLNTLG
jgi:predicted secreted acid phosphatase